MAGEKVCPICEDEWSAMMGLPYLQSRLYMILRWYMDVATRRVGIKRGVSLQGLCEELYVEPAPGRVDSGSPTKKAVRSALQQLEKHGMIEPCGNGEVLAFLLPKAGGISVRSKLKGHKRGTVSGHAMGHGESLVPQGNPDEIGHAMGQWVNGLKGHTSEVRVNPLSVEAVAAALPAVDKKLSTGAQLPLVPVLSDSGVAEWVRLKEFARGCRARVLASDVRNTGWIASGVSAEQIAEAYSLAAGDREVTKNPAPLNAAFLDIFVQRVLKGSLVCRGGGVPRTGGASGALAEKEAAALRLGVAPRAEGESVASFVSRIGLEEEARALGLSGQQEGESVVGLMARIDAAKAERRRISG